MLQNVNRKLSGLTFVLVILSILVLIKPELRQNNLYEMQRAININLVIV